MNHTELIDALAERTGESKAAVRRVLTALADVAEEQIAAGESLYVSRIGRIEASWRNRTTIRNIRNRRRMLVGGRWTLRFRPAASLKRCAADRGDQHWRSPEHQQAWRIAETLVSDLELYNKARPTLDDALTPEQVHERCVGALGEDWKRARRTYDADVPAAVREVHDYLLESAIERWS